MLSKILLPLLNVKMIHCEQTTSYFGIIQNKKPISKKIRFYNRKFNEDCSRTKMIKKIALKTIKIQSINLCDYHYQLHAFYYLTVNHYIKVIALNWHF